MYRNVIAITIFLPRLFVHKTVNYRAFIFNIFPIEGPYSKAQRTRGGQTVCLKVRTALSTEGLTLFFFLYLNCNISPTTANRNLQIIPTFTFAGL